MKILFSKPSQLSQEKNAQLLSQLSDILAHKNTDDMATHLMLELDNELIEVESIQQLFALCQEWGIDQSPLESLLQMVDMHAN